MKLAADSVMRLLKGDSGTMGEKSARNLEEDVDRVMIDEAAIQARIQKLGSRLRKIMQIKMICS